MNGESATLLRARARQVEKHGGLEAFRKHVQQHYRLKTVLRVSVTAACHCCACVAAGWHDAKHAASGLREVDARGI